MENVNEMLIKAATNNSLQCNLNQTATRVRHAAENIFYSIIPYGPAVPALISVVVCLTLFSLVANVFSVYTINRSNDLSELPRFILFKSLIFSDLLQTVTFASAVLFSLFYNKAMAFTPWCHFQFVVGGVCTFARLATITCMALERYLLVCHALRYTVMVTGRRVKKVLTLIWVCAISTGFISLGLVVFKRSQENVAQVTVGLLCYPDIMEQHVGSPRVAALFRKVTDLLTLHLCLLVHGFSYFRMYRNASNAVIPFSEINAAARKTVLVSSVMLFLQLLPQLIKMTSDALWGFEDSSESQDNCEPATLASFVSLLVKLLIPPCMNPLMYWLSSVKVRKALVEVFRGREENNETPAGVANRGDQELGEKRLRNVEDLSLPEAT
ncbi:growth hormone secretagogue receptor type 1 [Anableps anableps]